MNKIERIAAPPLRPELVCPAGTPAGLRTAVDAGADAVYCGFQNATNARNSSSPGSDCCASSLSGVEFIGGDPPRRMCAPQ